MPEQFSVSMSERIKAIERCAEPHSAKERLPSDPMTRWTPKSFEVTALWHRIDEREIPPYDEDGVLFGPAANSEMILAKDV